MSDYRTAPQRQFDRLRYSPAGRRADGILGLAFLLAFAALLAFALLA